MEDTTKRSADEEENDSEGQSLGEFAQTDPSFVRYLFTPGPTPNCVFLVGEESKEIRAENRFLMAHSKVFRLMLQDSALAERGNVRVEDIEPDAFKNLLRFVYGYNNVLSNLAMKEAVDLVYVAEKYMVEELKPKLSTHISSMLSIENVCIPLQRPECYEQKLLKDAINQKIQDFTDVILQRKNFLDLNMSGLLNILQQDTLAVREIELWRGVLKWAKHNAESEDITILRELLTGPLKYIRFCTLALEDFCKEVCLTKLLLDHEVSMIINSITNKIVSENLVTVCNTIQTRNSSTKNYVKLMSSEVCHCSSNKSIFNIYTNESPITMLAAIFKSNDHPVLGAIQNLKFQCMCYVSVTHSDYGPRTTHEAAEPVHFDYEQNVDFGKFFKIPLIVKGEYMKLSKYSKYTFVIEFSCDIHASIKCYSNCKVDFDSKYLRFELQEKYHNYKYIKCSSVKNLWYYRSQ